MTEKTEWELLDGPPSGERPTLRHVLKALLGRHWMWKIAGVAVVASLALVLLAMLAGVVIVLMAVGAILSIGIASLRRWLGRDQRSRHLMRRY